jgi:hypothetical protein
VRGQSIPGRSRHRRTIDSLPKADGPMAATELAALRGGDVRELLDLGFAAEEQAGIHLTEGPDRAIGLDLGVVVGIARAGDPGVEREEGAEERIVEAPGTSAGAARPSGGRALGGAPLPACPCARRFPATTRNNCSMVPIPTNCSRLQ